MCTSSNLKIFTPVEATHFPKRGIPSIIDFFLVSKINNCSAPVSCCELSSDHNPVIMLVGHNTETSKNDYVYNFKKADWVKFRRIIDESINLNFEIDSKEKIDFHTKKFIDIIKNTIKLRVPKIKLKNRFDLPSEILTLIKQKKCVS